MGKAECNNLLGIVATAMGQQAAKLVKRELGRSDKRMPQKVLGNELMTTLGKNGGNNGAR